MIRWVALILLLVSGSVWAQPDLPALIVTSEEDGGAKYSVSLQLLFLMTTLTLLPTALIMLTPFTRIIIILAILRQGIGMAQTPNNQIMIGLALFVTFFVMTPVLSKVHTEALDPYMNEELSFTQAVELGREPIRKFMANQVRESDLTLFTDISGATIDDPESIPMGVLIPAFITSEIKTAFQIGFLLLLPFLVIDLVVASVLMSMGMVMLSPLVISLPFKLMLFVMVDGWGLIVGTVAASFYI